MKNQALFSLKDKSKKLKCELLQFLFGALRLTVCLNNYLSEFIGYWQNCQPQSAALLVSLIWACSDCSWGFSSPILVHFHISYFSD